MLFYYDNLMYTYLFEIRESLLSHTVSYESCRVFFCRLRSILDPFLDIAVNHLSHVATWPRTINSITSCVTLTKRYILLKRRTFLLKFYCYRYAITRLPLTVYTCDPEIWALNYFGPNILPEPLYDFQRYDSGVFRNKHSLLRELLWWEIKNRDSNDKLFGSIY